MMFLIGQLLVLVRDLLLAAGERGLVSRLSVLEGLEERVRVLGRLAWAQVGDLALGLSRPPGCDPGPSRPAPSLSRPEVCSQRSSSR
jgi:hypothetical protein